MELPTKFTCIIAVSEKLEFIDGCLRHISSSVEKVKQSLKWSGDMMDRYFSPKFGVNPHDSFQENNVYRHTTTDTHAMTVVLQCSSTKQIYSR